MTSERSYSSWELLKFSLSYRQSYKASRSDTPCCIAIYRLPLVLLDQIQLPCLFYLGHASVTKVTIFVQNVEPLSFALIKSLPAPSAQTLAQALLPPVNSTNSQSNYSINLSAGACVGRLFANPLMPFLNSPNFMYKWPASLCLPFMGVGYVNIHKLCNV